MDKIITLLNKSRFNKKRLCQKCNKSRNHAGISSNVFYCNNCKPKKGNK